MMLLLVEAFGLFLSGDRLRTRRSACILALPSEFLRHNKGTVAYRLFALLVVWTEEFWACPNVTD